MTALMLAARNNYADAAATILQAISATPDDYSTTTSTSGKLTSSSPEKSSKKAVVDKSIKIDSANEGQRQKYNRTNSSKGTESANAPSSSTEPASGKIVKKSIDKYDRNGYTALIHAIRPGTRFTAPIAAYQYQYYYT
jgi:uncharacterized protein (DUF2342 family)